MRRFLIRLYVFVLVATFSAIALVDLGLPRVFHSRYTEMQREAVQGYSDLLSQRILSHPYAEWPHVIDDLNLRSRNRLSLVSIPPSDLIHEQDLADLHDGLPVFAADGNAFYLRLGSTTLAARVGKTKFRTQAVFYAAYGIVAALVLAASLLWVRRHWTELDSLSSVAEEFGHGDMSARSQLPRTSYISGLASRFNQMADRIELSFEAQKHLMNAVSHELRTPISRVAFELELLKSSTSLSKVHARAEAMHGDIKELESLVAEILELGRLEHLLPGVTRAPFDVQPVIEMAIEATRPEAAAANISVHAQLNGVSRLCGESHGIGRALANLLRNAIRYATSSVVITVLETSGHTVTISVEDDGPGVPEGQRVLVFQPFHRLDSSRDRRTGGHGLGLSIVMQVVKAHHGSAVCEQSKLGGARFVMLLPGASADGRKMA
ncbi:ATP-binding protein [Cupriavidus sp. 2TAF22]|uniref:ATP-binding protein n=1 Tax=unclassified Cupriavidus TaxID=2640874 RepID=UPI003F8F3DDA